MRPTALPDRAVAVELAWTVFMMRRPWSLDDEDLRALVEHPPTSHAHLLGELLSIRFADWVRRAVVALVKACVGPSGSDGVLPAEEVQRLADLKTHYEARATLVVQELAGLLEVEEPHAELGEEIQRWRWMLHDYTEALDPSLHAWLRAIEVRQASTAHEEDLDGAWREVVELRQLDASVNLLLARATMLHAEPGSRSVLGFTDPLSTRAFGSFAWWCRWLVDAIEEDQPLGDRIHPEQLEPFVAKAVVTLERLDAGLLETLRRLFPGLG